MQQKIQNKHIPREWLNGWHVDANLNRQYDFIDGLRGVAILMVLACHHLYINPESTALIQLAGQFFASLGHGIQLFFALSGFLISGPFWKRKVSGSVEVIPKGYVKRRFWKIYPPLALSVLMLGPFYVLTKNDWAYFVTGVRWLCGLPFVLPVAGNFNPVMWTLVVEVHFYAILPVAFYLLRRVSSKTTLWLLPTAFLLVPLLFRATTGLSATFDPEINDHFPAAMDAFCGGILIAGLNVHGTLRKSWANLALAGVALWLAALILNSFAHTPEMTRSLVHGMEMLGSACLICLIADPQHCIARLLATPWLRWCGIISYEWYLLHQPFALWTRIFLGPANGSFLKYLIILGLPLLLTAVLAAVVFRYFSLPLLRYGRRRGTT